MKQEAEGHEGGKPQRAAFCGNLNMIFTSGFSRMSSRQLGVWKAVSFSEYHDKKQRNTFWTILDCCIPTGKPS